MSGFTRRYQENEQLQKICRYIVEVIMIIMSAYALVIFTCERSAVVGNSMQPGLNNSDIVLINRMAYAVIPPSRYDVVAFKTDGVKTDKLHIKRIIGLPGETVQIKEGKIYINDLEISNDIVNGYILTAGIAEQKLTLAKGEYFVLGDNRNNSEDSRFSNIGIVKAGSIAGRVWAVASPLNRAGLVK